MKKAFTLIELLVVISIIAVLSTLSIVSLGNARQKSRDTRRVSDIKQIRTALEMYFDQNMAYPAAPSGTSTLGVAASSACLNSTGWAGTGCTGTVYMQNVPDDPQYPNKIYTYGVGGAGNSTYTISYVLENGGAKVATQASIE